MRGGLRHLDREPRRGVSGERSAEPLRRVELREEHGRHPTGAEQLDQSARRCAPPEPLRVSSGMDVGEVEEHRRWSW